jgi:tetratricopeptide (TPR) repeat protein
MRPSFGPMLGTPFEYGVIALEEARLTWNKGAAPGILSRAARAFDDAAKSGDVGGEVGAAVARALAGDSESAIRRLREAIAKHPDEAGPYVALGVVLLRDADPLSHADEAAWALCAARDLAPQVAFIERELAVALCAAGHFMAALQSARAALALDPEDIDARLWSALLRLYFGGDASSSSVLVELAEEADNQLRGPMFWLGAAAGLYARCEFHEARIALRRSIAPMKMGYEPERPFVDAARRWMREVRGFGPGVAMAPDRWLKDVGGPQSEYVRTRAALTALRDACQRDPERALAEGVSALEVEAAISEMEARTRRGMLDWAARLLLRGFAEVFLPLRQYLEPPPYEAFAAMGVVLLDG